MLFNRYVFVAIMAIVISSFSQILMKKGAMKEYKHFLGDYINPYVISGYLMMLIPMLMTIYVYSGLDYLYVPVMESTGYVIVPILSYIFFKDRVNKYRIIGIMLIIIGVVVYYSV